VSVGNARQREGGGKVPGSQLPPEESRDTAVVGGGEIESLRDGPKNKEEGGVHTEEARTGRERNFTIRPRGKKLSWG